VQLSRLLHAHEIILKEARTMARQAAEAGDDGTNDLLVSDVIRTNEMQVWFVGEHLATTPLLGTSSRRDRRALKVIARSLLEDLDHAAPTRGSLTKGAATRCTSCRCWGRQRWQP